jgi:DNA invertase Pin-like site-specific DNA recombinase
MIKRQANGAVIYVRVSTDEQANGPLNLMNQEKRCGDYCEKNGLKVLEVFTDAGASGRSAVHRVQFQTMLGFCKASRRDIGFVVVQDLSRFARDAKDQADAIYELGKNGIRVRSVYEPNVDDTAAGKLAANILAAFNQHFSDALSEKMKDRMRASASAGRFPWRAPIGYMNIGGKTGANIKPDARIAPLIARAFELMATGKYKKIEVLKIVTDEGLKTPMRQTQKGRTTGGKPLTPQTFQAVLRNPLYAGWITLPSDPTFEPVKGLHEALVTQELFDRVQDVLDGRRPSVAPKRKLNAALPLKCLVRCENCGTPLTGGFAKGRNERYGYYWCRKKGCRAVKVRKERLEAEFISKLRTLRPKDDTLADFPKVAAKAWNSKQGDFEKQRKKLLAKLEECRALKSELLKSKLRGEVSQKDYEENNAEFAGEIAAMEAERRVIESDAGKMDSFIRFAELRLIDISCVWEIASPEQRQRVQNLLFRDGLDYSMSAGFLNRSKPCLFNVLESISSESTLLASPTGFEPVLSP